MDRPGIRTVARQIVRAGKTGARAVGLTELAVVFLVVPSLLIGVQLLPGSEAWAFSLATDGILTNRWTLWTAFASSYIHADGAHLGHNVAVYWMVVGVAYPLSVVAGWRTRFAGVVIACLLVVPVGSAWATLAALGSITDAPSIGFSDINTGLLGYLLVVWFVAADRVTDGRLPRQYAFVAAPASIAVVLAAPTSVWYFPQYPTAAAGAAGVAVIAFVWARRHRYATDRTPADTTDRTPADTTDRTSADSSATSVVSSMESSRIDPVHEFLLVLGASVVVSGVIGSMLLVPHGSNVWAHLAGYLVGLVAALPLVGFDA